MSPSSHPCRLAIRLILGGCTCTNRVPRPALLWLVLALCWTTGLAPRLEADWVGPGMGERFRADWILVQPKPGVTRAELAALHDARHSQVLRTFARLGQLQVVRVAAGETVPSLVDHYQKSGMVEFAEPDYAVRAAATPND